MCICVYLQKRRRQLSTRDQLDKWKRSEELSKELVTEASNKLQRPKSVDPGMNARVGFLF